MKQASARKDADPEPARPSAEELYTSNLPVVWGVLRLGDVREADQEDLAQQVRLTAMRSIDTYDPTTPAKGWIASITWNAVRNYRRKTAREQLATDSDELFDAIEDPAPSAEEIMMEIERDRILARALEKIPEKPRRVLILSQIQGRKMEDVQSIMAISRATAFRYLQTAKEQLAQAIERMSKSERDAIGLLAIAAGPLTDAQLDTFFANLRAARKVHVPPELCDEIPEFDPLHDDAPVSGTRPTNPTSPTTHALRAAIHGKTAGYMAMLVVGMIGGAVLEHVRLASEHDRTELVTITAPTAEPSPTTTPTLLPTSPSPAPTITVEQPITTLDLPKSTPTARKSATPEGVHVSGSALMRRARRALEEGKPSEAMRLSDEYRHTFPTGAHTQDCESLRIQALVKLGQKSRAEAELGRFRAKYPDSALLPLLDQSVGASPAR